MAKNTTATENKRQPNDVSVIVSMVDRGTSTTGFSRTRGFHCNSSATYQITVAEDAGYSSVALNEGSYYPYSIVNILSSTGTALSADDIILAY